MASKFSKKGKRFLLRRLLPVTAALGVCAGGAYVVNSAQYNSRFLPGTVINGIDVSDQTLEEAEHAIRNVEEDYSLKLNFRGGSTETLTAKDMALRYDCARELQGILNEQNGYTWLARELGDGAEYTLKTGISYAKNTLLKSLKKLPELQEGNYTVPEDANLSYDNGISFNMVPEIEGTELLPDELLKETGKAILKKTDVLNLEDEPEVYAEPAVRSDDEELVARMDALNGILDADVDIVLSDGTVRKVTGKDTKDWISVENGLYVVNEDVVAEKAAALMADVAKSDDTYGYSRPFMSTNYGMQKFDSDYLHGHTLDQAAMADSLTKLVLSGKSGKIEPVYSQYEDSPDPRFGGTYVEVDIYAQRVYYYENYELVYSCNCVTGTEGYRSTPSGIFSIEEKQRGRTLNGYASDGSLAYSSYVSYWMCFLPHYGLHDASWRDSFGGSIYEYDGSHGCVNLPTSAAATLYDLLDYGTPVIVLRGSTST